MILYGGDEHLLAITPSIDATSHKHTFLQLTLGLEQPVKMGIDDESISGHGFVLGSNVSHSLSGGPVLLLLADRASVLGDMLRRYAAGQSMRVLDVDDAIEAGRYAAAHYSHVRGPEEYRRFLIELLRRLGFSYEIPRLMDARIVATLESLSQCRHSEHPIDELARAAGLSSSRLSHLFKEQTGIALGSYLVLHKLQKAYYSIFDGISITEAAMSAGFDSPSHFAAASRRLLGMSAADIRKDSVFLKVSRFM